MTKIDIFSGFLGAGKTTFIKKLITEGFAGQQVVEQYHPDRIVIEPSGVGKLSDVTRAVEGVAEHLDVQLNSFVTVADVNKVKMYMKNFG